MHILVDLTPSASIVRPLGRTSSSPSSSRRPSRRSSRCPCRGPPTGPRRTSRKTRRARQESLQSYCGYLVQSRKTGACTDIVLICFNVDINIRNIFASSLSQKTRRESSRPPQAAVRVAQASQGGGSRKQMYPLLFGVFGLRALGCLGFSGLEGFRIHIITGVRRVGPHIPPPPAVGGGGCSAPPARTRRLEFVVARLLETSLKLGQALGRGGRVFLTNTKPMVLWFCHLNE